MKSYLRAIAWLHQFGEGADPHEIDWAAEVALR